MNGDFLRARDENEGKEPAPSKHGRILFVTSDYDNDFKPLIVGHEGYYIDQEITEIGHVDVAEMISMPPEFQQEPYPCGFFVWEGDVDWECLGGSWEGTPAEYQITLEKGKVRKATVDDLALARGDFHIPEWMNIKIGKRYTITNSGLVFVVDKIVGRDIAIGRIRVDNKDRTWLVDTRHTELKECP